MWPAERRPLGVSSAAPLTDFVFGAIGLANQAGGQTSITILPTYIVGKFMGNPL
jgi:hypothetical protein